MAQSHHPLQAPALTPDGASNLQSLWRRLFGKDRGTTAASDTFSKGGIQQDDSLKPGPSRRGQRRVVSSLPRAQTFKRQQSERRHKLEPVHTTSAERRAVSVDRRLQYFDDAQLTRSDPRTSAPEFIHGSFSPPQSTHSLPRSRTETSEEQLHGDADRPGDSEVEPGLLDVPLFPDTVSTVDAQSMTTSQYDAMIRDELERIWILNLSMHFRDKSKREKFFVTYRQHSTVWRRVTVSLDYRNASENSLEWELFRTKFQHDKSAKIYEAIRESLVEIDFYNTVTNLKLQTTEGRLHVHVVEDVNEIIDYPNARMIQHLKCNRVKERDIEFDSHMSGFVYKVRVNDEILVKKEIPGPDTIDEFLYEINALSRLKHADSVIKFYGVIVDDRQECVKGLLISYAEQGALIDILYDSDRSLPWSTRERWARQIIQGLSEIHEAGFVQGDFTLSNIVVDGEGNAKIIDINRRGCPVGWEPPEATPLIENNQRISMYIGVKSDLYQLGMVLWALATQEDDPEAQGRPLRISPSIPVPDWYRKIVDSCLAEDPRMRIHALHLLSMIPEAGTHDSHSPDPRQRRSSLPAISVSGDMAGGQESLPDGCQPEALPWIRPVHPPTEWSYGSWSHQHTNPATGISDGAYFYPARGRSPPSPLPSNYGGTQPSGCAQPWPPDAGLRTHPPTRDLHDDAAEGLDSALPDAPEPPEPKQGIALGRSADDEDHHATGPGFFTSPGGQAADCQPQHRLNGSSKPSSMKTSLVRDDVSMTMRKAAGCKGEDTAAALAGSPRPTNGGFLPGLVLTASFDKTVYGPMCYNVPDDLKGVGSVHDYPSPEEQTPTANGFTRALRNTDVATAVLLDRA